MIKSCSERFRKRGILTIVQAMVAAEAMVHQRWGKNKNQRMILGLPAVATCEIPKHKRGLLSSLFQPNYRR